jgi:precorrin-2 dehydrogenase/sirohydrochlorin ferrochelatase
MGYLPIFLNLEGRRCLVVGGGEVAERKVTALLDAGAQVRLVSPALTPVLRQLSASGSVEYLPRAWEPGDLSECVLAFAATDDRELHCAIAAEARALGVPLNVADEPDLCDFISPSVVRRGDLQIAISTSGASPALASRMRRDLEAMVGAEYETVTSIMRAVRLHLQAHERDPRERARILQAIARSEIASLVREEDWAGLDSLLRTHLRLGLDRLGIERIEGLRGRTV